MEPYALCLPWGEGIRAIVPTAFRCLFSQMPGRSLPGAILSRESTTVRPRRPWHEPSCCLPPCSGRNNLRCVPEIRNTGKCLGRENRNSVRVIITRFLFEPPRATSLLKLPLEQSENPPGRSSVPLAGSFPLRQTNSSCRRSFRMTATVAAPGVGLNSKRKPQSSHCFDFFRYAPRSAVSCISGRSGIVRKDCRAS